MEKIGALRKNVRAKYYHVTFEPLFDDPGEVDFRGIDWVPLFFGKRVLLLSWVKIWYKNCPTLTIKF